MHMRKQKNGLGNKDNRRILMKSKKKSDEKAQVIEIEIEGNLEDLLTEEELKQLEEDEYLDGDQETFLLGLNITSQKKPTKNSRFFF